MLIAATPPPTRNCRSIGTSARSLHDRVVSRLRYNKLAQNVAGENWPMTFSLLRRLRATARERCRRSPLTSQHFCQASRRSLAISDTAPGASVTGRLSSKLEPAACNAANPNFIKIKSAVDRVRSQSLCSSRRRINSPVAVVMGCPPSITSKLPCGLPFLKHYDVPVMLERPSRSIWPAYRRP